MSGSTANAIDRTELPIYGQKYGPFRATNETFTYEIQI